jgi:enoyl-CoA hydratase/carnithine racemase
MTEELIVTTADGVMEIRFNRPEKKNALTRAMYEGVVTAFGSAENDPAIRVIMLTGTGDTFTSATTSRISSSALRIATLPPHHHSSPRYRR